MIGISDAGWYTNAIWWLDDYHSFPHGPLTSTACFPLSFDIPSRWLTLSLIFPVDASGHTGIYLLTIHSVHWHSHPFITFYHSYLFIRWYIHFSWVVSLYLILEAIHSSFNSDFRRNLPPCWAIPTCILIYLSGLTVLFWKFHFLHDLIGDLGSNLPRPCLGGWRCSEGTSADADRVGR